MKSSLSQEMAAFNSVNFYTLSSILPDPDAVLAAKGRGVSLYRELLTDAHLRACVMSRKAGTLSRGWQLEGHSGIMSFVQGVLDDLDVEKIISDILDAPLFGFVPMEVVWHNDGKNLVPTKVEAKPQEWFLFDVQNRLRLRTRKNPVTGEVVPKNKFLCPSHNSSYTNPYGEKLLSSVFWPATFKKGGIKFWVSFAEKYGMPWALGKIPRQTLDEEAKNLQTVLENMVQDGVAVFDDNCEVELKEASGKSASCGVYSELIEFSNNEISKAILGQTLTTQAGSSGSYALGKVHSDVRKDIVFSDVRLVEKTLNQLIKWVVALNYPQEDCPKLVMSDLDALKIDLAKRDKVLADAGVKFSKDYFIDKYGLKPHEFSL